MSAIRLARGATGKAGVVKFRGCYHGHVDSLLVKAGSGLATFGTPDSAGVPSDLAKHTLVAEFNHIDTVSRIVKEKAADIACLIMEPVMGNMGVVLPDKGLPPGRPGNLRQARHIARARRVITGFRVAYGGAQELYGVKADLTCPGGTKIVGGGFPDRRLRRQARLDGKTGPAGRRLPGGHAFRQPRGGEGRSLHAQAVEGRDALRGPGVPACARLSSEVARIASKAGVPYAINGLTSMFTGFFSDRDVVDYQTASASDSRRYAAFFRLMLDEGIFFAPASTRLPFSRWPIRAGC